MDIQCNRLDKGFELYQKEYEEKAINVLRSGRYIMCEELENFEREFAGYLGSKYCVGVASGLDSLSLAFRALNIGAGDEVIVQGNTYIASIMGITLNGATPVFVEPDEYYNIAVDKLEEKITSKTKAILVVHLYGQASQMNRIMELAEKYHLKIVEDCAQSHGAQYQGKMTGTFGDIGCYSFYPTKNLGAFGDGGAIVTDNKEIEEKIRILRNYGSEKKYHNKMVGVNSRLDEIQAGLLRVKLSHIGELIDERRNICNHYLNEIKNTKIILPKVREESTTVWHQFVVRVEKRKQFMEYLEEKGIHTLIHYPIPPHLSEAYVELGMKEGSLPITEQYANEIISLPLYNGLKKEEQDYVIAVINSWN